MFNHCWWQTHMLSEPLVLRCRKKVFSFSCNTYITLAVFLMSFNRSSTYCPVMLSWVLYFLDRLIKFQILMGKCSTWKFQIVNFYFRIVWEVLWVTVEFLPAMHRKKIHFFQYISCHWSRNEKILANLTIQKVLGLKQLQRAHIFAYYVPLTCINPTNEEMKYRPVFRPRAERDRCITFYHSIYDAKSLLVVVFLALQNIISKESVLELDF